MDRSYLPWALLVAAVAAGAFLLVWSQLEEPQPPRARPMPAQATTRAQSDSQAAEAPAQPKPTRVLFAFDEARLQRAQAEKLAQLAARLKASAFERLDAVGHADRMGPETYNHALSQRRADAVKAYLVSQGIEARAVKTHAKGESEPLTGDGCIGLGPETRENRALIECLQPDRRVTVAVIIAP